MSELKLISEKDLALVENNALSLNQLSFLLKNTPEKYVRERRGKGGQKWKYVSGGYVQKTLNLMFGFNWSFEVVKFEVIGKQAIVLGKLTCVSNGQTITKMQFGRQDIKYKRDSEDPLDLGNDLKGATTDALKKCASQIGIASDIYNKEEFEAFEIADENSLEEQLTEIKDLFAENGTKLNDALQKHAYEVIQNKEINSYEKLLKTLKSL